MPSRYSGFQNGNVQYCSLLGASAQMILAILPQRIPQKLYGLPGGARALLGLCPPAAWKTVSQNCAPKLSQRAAAS